MPYGQFGDPCTVLNVAQVTVDTTSTGVALIAANARRRSLVVTNTSATATVYLSSGSVSSSNGHALPPGQSISFNFYIGALKAIASTGSVTVTTCEEAKDGG